MKLEASDRERAEKILADLFGLPVRTLKDCVFNKGRIAKAVRALPVSEEKP